MTSAPARDDGSSRALFPTQFAKQHLCANEVPIKEGGAVISRSPTIGSRSAYRTLLPDLRADTMFWLRRIARCRETTARLQ